MTGSLSLDDRARDAVTRKYRVPVHDCLLEQGLPPEDNLVRAVAAFVIRTRGEQAELNLNDVSEGIYTMLVNDLAGRRKGLKKQFGLFGTMTDKPIDLSAFNEQMYGAYQDIRKQTRDKIYVVPVSGWIDDGPKGAAFNALWNDPRFI